MANPKKTAEGTWRIQVMVGSKRSNGTFDTYEEADKWGLDEKKRMKRAERIRSAASKDFLLSQVPQKLAKAISDAPYTKDEIIASALPAHSMCGIYFLMIEDEVVYVGQSIDLLGRVSRHKREGREFSSFSYILCEKDRLNDLEALYITLLMPWLNFTLGRVPRNIADAA